MEYIPFTSTPFQAPLPVANLEHDGGSFVEICSFRDSHEDELLAGPTASCACSIKAFAQSAVIASLHVPNEVPMFSPGNLAAADMLVKKTAQAPKLELAAFAVKLKAWGAPR